MIVVKIMMWPGGREEQERELQRLTIANIGGSVTSGDYRVRALKGAEYSKRPGTTWRSGLVRGFPRKKLGPFDLLLRALVAIVADRNPQSVTQLGSSEFGDEPMECL